MHLRDVYWLIKLQENVIHIFKKLEKKRDGRTRETYKFGVYSICKRFLSLVTTWSFIPFSFTFQLIFNHTIKSNTVKVRSLLTVVSHPTSGYSIPYILIEDLLNSYNLKFVIIKKWPHPMWQCLKLPKGWRGRIIKHLGIA